MPGGVRYSTTSAAFGFATGDAATSPLLAYLDDSINNLPLEPNGAKVTYLPDSDTGLFRL